MTVTRVSFYVLSGAEPSTRLGYACRLTEKAYKLHHRIHAHVGDTAMARRLDDLLWTFRQGSFVPHEVLESMASPPHPPKAPVTIGFADAARSLVPPDADLLINLAAEVPEFFSRYPRIAEIIDGSPGSREAGRARHRFYRAQGLVPETHEVT